MREAHGGEGFRCPFCDAPLPPPEEIKMQFGETEGAICPCGAVYVFDRTGRKLGEAFTEALLLAYEGDYDRAFSAEEGQYEEMVMVYNQKIQRFFLEEGRLSRGGKYIFIKRKK
jgi:hypothetical protein